MTTAIRAEALFLSSLQPSQMPSLDRILTAVIDTLHERGGSRGCAAACAAEFGDHPETSAARMRWALAAVGE
jgi:hypothetical protein